MESLSLRPIGYVRSARDLKFQAPNQPREGDEERNLIELRPEFALALSDLEGFDRIWVVSWFHRNVGWRSRVLPPRGPAVRRGLFATRSPHRPNPIGLTSTPLLAVRGTTLEVGPLDLLDGTPVLDLKPYLATVDAHPGSSLGWVQAVEEWYAQPPRFVVEVRPSAQVDLDWLRENWGVDFWSRAREILERDPSAHRTRRILGLADGRFRLACGPWRAYYRVEGERVWVDEIDKGFPDAALASPGSDRIPDRDAQLAFMLRKQNGGSGAAGPVE